MDYFVKQIGSKDCAFACLKMLLANVYKSKKFLYYPQDDKDISFSLNEIIKKAADEGLVIGGYRYNNRDLIFDELTYPMLITLKQENKLHMVMVKKTKKDRLKVFDPAIGIYWMKKDDLYEVWNGEFLQVLEVKGSNYKPKINNPIPLKLRLPIFIFQVLSSIFLMLGLFFVNKEFNFYIPLLLLVGFAICEFTYKRLLISGMKYFDKMILERAFSGNNSNFKEKYLKMNYFKTLVLGRPIQLINSIIIIVFGIFILTINGYLNLINVTLICAFTVLLDFLEIKIFDARERNIEYSENTIFENGNYVGQNFINSISKVQKNVYDLVSYKNFKKYFLVFLTASVCLVYCAFSNEINLNYLLFHAVFYYYIADNVSKINELYLKTSEYTSFTCLFRYYCNIN
ncbi:MAG: hypothetical protein J6X03_04870 [Bacilli bacterium]|nr:hypothetical protein [Bacilli bacterium]